MSQPVAIWDLIEEMAHELALIEMGDMLDPDYEMAQEQLAWDFMESLDQD